MRTTKMKKVLIALDYDPTAQKVAEMGFSLAKTMGADVILLHVIADSVYYSSTEYSPIMGFSDYMGVSQLQLDNLDGLKKAAQHFLDKSKHHLGDESIQTMVEEGDFAESILKSAKSNHADVIVIGSHSQKWLEKIVMGSVTEKVLNHTTIPLFVVPTKKH
jgi:nucleotide-binding universal stress UspA family protein